MLADADLEAAALQVEVFAGRAVGMQHHDEVREPAALLVRAAGVVRVLGERDDSFARRMDRRACRIAIFAVPSNQEGSR